MAYSVWLIVVSFASVTVARPGVFIVACSVSLIIPFRLSVIEGGISHVCHYDFPISLIIACALFLNVDCITSVSVTYRVCISGFSRVDCLVGVTVDRLICLTLLVSLFVTKFSNENACLLFALCF